MTVVLPSFDVGAVQVNRNEHKCLAPKAGRTTVGDTVAPFLLGWADSLQLSMEMTEVQGHSGAE